MSKNLYLDAKVVRVMTSQAAGTTALASDSVDMQDFDAVQFIPMFGAITAGAATSVHVAQSSDDSTFVDLEGTSITIADDDDGKAAVIDIERPTDRYVRCEIARATENAVVDGVIALVYKCRRQPVDTDASVVDIEFHASPDEGTA